MFVTRSIEKYPTNQTRRYSGQKLKYHYAPMLTCTTFKTFSHPYYVLNILSSDCYFVTCLQRFNDIFSIFVKFQVLGRRFISKIGTV